ncbi:MAG: DUF1648 domain-containing protein [Paludibacter sp.]|jgi:hypothetical protein|nr:DUF1648 domain-containing protein [Paludibacter sp.]
MKLFINRTPYYWVLEILSVAGLLYAFYPLLFYGSLSPDVKIPIHFNALGDVDGWAGRNYLFLLPAISLIFYIGFSILERYPKFLNYPFNTKDIDKKELNKTGISIIRHIKFISIIVFAHIGNRAFNIAIGKDVQFGIVIFLLLFALFLIVTVFIARVYKLKQK